MYRVVFGITAKESRPASVALMSPCWRGDSRLPNVSVGKVADAVTNLVLDRTRRLRQFGCTAGGGIARPAIDVRSEERRVGKECA